MAFHHRKLLNASYADPGAGYPCGIYCDSTKTSTESCPEGCFDTCSGYCISGPKNAVSPPFPSPVIDTPIADPSHKNHKFPHFLPILLAILTTCFFLFTCYTIYKFCICCCDSRRRRRRRRGPGAAEEGGLGSDEFLDEDHGPVVDHPIWYIRTVGLQPAVISAITIVRFKKGDGLIEGTDCSVCLNEFEEDETLRLLPKCNHAFHIPCIDTWLRSHTNCPLCRAGIVNNTAAAALPSSELAVQNSGSEEENRAESSRIDRIEVEDDADSGSETRLSLDGNLEKEEANSFEGGLDLDGMNQPMRRSISVDSVSAKMITAAIANASEEKQSTVANNQSSERSLQIGSSSVKRSLSCSAKVFLSRYSNNK